MKFQVKTLSFSLRRLFRTNERAIVEDGMRWDVKPKSIDGYNICGPLVIFASNNTDELGS